MADRTTGPKKPRSTVLSIEEEAVIVALRKHTLLPLDDCLYALRPTIPQLTRSSLHRCLQRHGISRLPDVEGDKPQKNMPKIGGFRSFNPARKTIFGFEAMLWLKKGFDFAGQWSVREQNDLRGTVLGIEKVNEI